MTERRGRGGRGLAWGRVFKAYPVLGGSVEYPGRRARAHPAALLIGNHQAIGHYPCKSAYLWIVVIIMSSFGC